MHVSLVQSYHHDCTWLKEKARCVQGSIVTLPGCLTCSIEALHVEVLFSESQLRRVARDKVEHGCPDVAAHVQQFPSPLWLPSFLDGPRLGEEKQHSLLRKARGSRRNIPRQRCSPGNLMDGCEFAGC